MTAGTADLRTTAAQRNRYLEICREIEALTGALPSMTPGEAGEASARIDDLQAEARDIRIDRQIRHRGEW